MRYIFVIVFITIAISVALCLFHVMTKRKSYVAPNSNPKVIKQPILYFYVGLFSTLFWFGFALFALLAPVGIFVEDAIGLRWAMFSIFLLFAFGCSWLAILQANWKIEIHDDDFIFRNTFRIKHIYKFDEIEEVFMSSTIRYKHLGKTVVSISFLQPNYDALSIALSNYRAPRKSFNAKDDYNSISL